MVNIKESPDPRTNLWAMTAFYLRFLRMQHGHSGDVVARWLNRSRSSISRLESGESQLKEHEAGILDERWKTGGLFSLLLHYARLGHDPHWLKSYRDFEERAKAIRMYDGQLVPSLFQTPEYARALLTAGRWRELDKAVETRMSMQKILHRSDPPEVWALLAETVLAPHIGGAEVMRAQLSHLLEISRLPTVYLRVVPNRAGANEGLDGPFRVITLNEGDIGFLEAPLGGRLEMNGSAAASLKSRFERIGAMALPLDSSQDLIQARMENLR